MITIRQITIQEDALLIGLANLLIDTVHSGSSVGFLAPLSSEEALDYWRSVFVSLGSGRQLWVAEQSGVVVGSVQLVPSDKANGRHRAEIQKLLVLSASRKQGIASKLMAAAEQHAASVGRTLLVLDTEARSVAETVYQRLGWQKIGETPAFAASPHGELRANAYYYKFVEVLAG